MGISKGTRLTSIIIVIMILTGAFFTVPQGQVSAEQAGDYTYSIVNGSAVISAYTGAGGAVTIPSTLGGYTVTSIGALSFSNSAGRLVTSIIIPNGVTSIDIYAFDGCSSLKSVTLGTGLVDIGTGAFEGCSSLLTLTTPNSVARIGSYSFYACSSLTTLTLGSGLISVGDHAFEECSSLLTLTIPNKVTSIGTSAFSECSSLTTVTISDSVLSVGKFAFFDCNVLTTVTFGRHVANIGSWMFYGCSLLTSIAFLGLAAPTIDGSSALNNDWSSWLPANSFAVRGHAYAASNFPAPGDTFNGLIMDAYVASVVPGAPIGLSATSADGKVTLSWTAPSWNGGATISDYKIYRGASSSLETYLGNTSSGSKLTLDDTGLTNGHAYYYQVSAVNSYGEGPKCSEISATPSVTLSVPLNLLASAGDGQVTLSWISPSSIGGSPIDYYIIYQDGVDVKHSANISAIISGLNNAQTYGFAVAAHNAAGAGPRTTTVSATPVQTRTIPGAPTGLAAITGDGQVALSWSAPVSNGGAVIDYYLVLVDSVARPDHFTTNSASVTGLTNAHSYSFTVVAHNVMGTSQPSKAVIAVPSPIMTIPGVPSGLAATPGDGQVSLSWSAPGSNGGAAIDYYQIYVDSVARPDQYQTNSATISGLSNGRTYNFTVCAHNVVGSGAQSSAFAATPSPAMSVPGVPTGLTATPGDTQIMLSWTAPGSNGGAAIDFYLVNINGVASSDHYTTTAATLTGLPNGQACIITIAAHNSQGTGPETPSISVTPNPTQTIPGAPTGLTAVPGDAQIELSWSTPGSNGGATIDYYLILVNGTARPDQYKTNSATLTSLSNGRAYSFTVVAHNIIGTSVQSGLVTATPFATMTVPDIPTGLRAIPGDGQVTISWSPPSNNGGSAIDYYLVVVDGVARPDHYTTNSTTVSHLLNGQNYSFTVAAHNAVGTSNESTNVSAIPTLPTTIPEAPIGLTITPGDGQINLSWIAPGSDGGAAIDYYVVYLDGDDIVHVNDTTRTIIGLTNGQSSILAVAAHNSMGVGPLSAMVAAEPSATVIAPDIPNGINAMPGDGHINLFWSVPGNNGGAEIDYYLVYVDGIAWPANFTNGSADISGLINGQTYNFTVAAHNVAGIGTQSMVLALAPSSTVAVPGLPSGLTGVPGNGLVYLSWSPPESNGGAVIDNYIIYQDGNVISHLNWTSKMISGLTNGQSYNFTVAAHNLIGIGEQASTINVTLSSSSSVPGTPINLTMTPGDGLIALSWTAPDSNGGDLIDYYVVYQDGNDVSHVTETSTTVTGLTNGLSYDFAVAAHNSVGMGELTSEVTASLISRSETPGAPTNLTITPGDGLITASWTAPDSSGSSEIDYYIVYQDGVDVAHPNGTITTITGLTNGQDYLFDVAAHNAVGIGNQSTIQKGSPIGPVSNETNTTSSSDPVQDHNDVAFNAGAVLFLMAAILGDVFVVVWFRRRS